MGLINPTKSGGGAPEAHAASHQNGGGDEISVAGLSGQLADAQLADITGITAHSGHVEANLDHVLMYDASAAANRKIPIEDLEASQTHLRVRKSTGGTITALTPCYVAGWSAGQGLVQVEAADNDDAAKMPAIGIAEGNITNSADGYIVTSGVMKNVNTSSFSVGAELYVSATGTLTATKPTAYASKVQKVAQVMRSHATLGTLVVFGAGRSNDVPNQPQVALTPTTGTITPTKSTHGLHWGVTATGNHTIANPSGYSAGDGGIFILNPGAFTTSWGASWAYTGGTAPVLTASQKNMLGWYYDGTLFILGLTANVRAIT